MSKGYAIVVKLITSLLVLRMFAACMGFPGHAGRWCAAQPSGEAAARYIRYGFTLRNTTNRLIAQAELWTYAPVQHTATQQRIHLDASLPFEELTDKAGNSILHFTIHHLPPYAAKIITIRADLLLSDTPLPGESGNSTPSLRDRSPQPYCESDDPEIMQLARQLQTNNPLRTAEQIFRWVSEHIVYAGYLKHPRGARYALTHKQGDCTEYMYLFVALCRAAGIPARGLGGYVVTQNSLLRPADYHNWAEFYVDGAWHLADPQRKVFMQHHSHYLVMHVIGARPDDHPMQHYSRFRCAGEGVQVTMN